MTIENAILESLIQDIKNVEQIQNYLFKVCNIDIDIKIMHSKIKSLLDSGWIFIVNHMDDTALETELDFCWFELTESGESECIERGLMMK